MKIESLQPAVPPVRFLGDGVFTSATSAVQEPPSLNTEFNRGCAPGTATKKFARVMAFTLAEVLVAVAVMGIVFVALYNGITAGVGVIAQARENLRATQIMTDRMEEMRIASWTDVSSFGTTTSSIPTNFWVPFFPNSSFTNSDISVNAPAAADGNFYYYGTLAIGDCGLADVGYTNDIKLITVTLVWTNGTRASSRAMSTYYSQYGTRSYLY